MAALCAQAFSLGEFRGRISTSFRKLSPLRAPVLILVPVIPGIHSSAEFCHPMPPDRRDKRYIFFFSWSPFAPIASIVLTRRLRVVRSTRSSLDFFFSLYSVLGSRRVTPPYSLNFSSRAVKKKQSLRFQGHRKSRRAEQFFANVGDIFNHGSRGLHDPEEKAETTG